MNVSEFSSIYVPLEGHVIRRMVSHVHEFILLFFLFSRFPTKNWSRSALHVENDRMARTTENGTPTGNKGRCGPSSQMLESYNSFEVVNTSVNPPSMRSTSWSAARRRRKHKNAVVASQRRYAPNSDTIMSKKNNDRRSNRNTKE